MHNGAYWYLEDRVLVSEFTAVVTRKDVLISNHLICQVLAARTTQAPLHIILDVSQRDYLDQDLLRLNADRSMFDGQTIDGWIVTADPQPQAAMKYASATIAQALNTRSESTPSLEVALAFIARWDPSLAPLIELAE
ncbi:MAG: hypothetical protein GYB67_12045 [Chloroflexi bacterium]|nr:hypothetical protein [Chloroflexota bacterium]